MRLSDRIIADVSGVRASSPLINLAHPGLLLKNLIWTYQVIVASEHLMEVAAEQSKGILKQYLTSHLEEERDHAKWMADDLKVKGVDVSKLPLERSAVELAGTQYYLIHHISPNCLLGYMAVLEGFPFPLQTLEKLEGLHGKDVLRCLRYHAENDIQHRKELFETIDQIDDPQIYENALRTQYLMDEAFRAYSQ